MWFLSHWPADFRIRKSSDGVNKLDKMNDSQPIQLELPLFEEQKNESARPDDQETDKSGGQARIEADYVGPEWFEL